MHTHRYAIQGYLGHLEHTVFLLKVKQSFKNRSVRFKPITITPSVMTVYYFHLLEPIMHRNQLRSLWRRRLYLSATVVMFTQISHLPKPPPQIHRRPAVY